MVSSAAAARLLPLGAAVLARFVCLAAFRAALSVARLSCFSRRRCSLASRRLSSRFFCFWRFCSRSNFRAAAFFFARRSDDPDRRFAEVPDNVGLSLRRRRESDEDDVVLEDDVEDDDEVAEEADDDEEELEVRRRERERRDRLRPR